MSRTGQYDACVQMTESALAHIVLTQHSVGIIRHQHYETSDKSRLEIIINAPLLSLNNHDSEFIHLNVKLFCRLANISDRSEMGETAVVDVLVRIKPTINNSTESSLSEANYLYIDWSNTSVEDMTVHHDDPDIVNGLRERLLIIMQRHNNDRFSIPTIGHGDSKAKAVGIRATENSSKKVISVLLNIQTDIASPTTNADTVFVNNDWALAIRRIHFIRGLNDGFMSGIQFPYQVSRKCTINNPWPMSGCANRTTVRIMSIEFELRNGYIYFSGDIDVHNSGLLVPDLHPSFSGRIYLSIQNDAIDVRISNITVETNSILADIIDFFSGNTIRNLIKNGISNAVNSRANDNISEYINSSIVTRIANADSRFNTDITLINNSITVDANGIVVQGSLVVPSNYLKPEVNYNIYRSESGKYILSAFGSYAPGSTIHKIEWRYPYTNWKTEGNEVSFVSFYQPLARADIQQSLSSNICLKIQDVRGLNATHCESTTQKGEIVVDVCRDRHSIPDFHQGQIPMGTIIPSSYNDSPSSYLETQYKRLFQKISETVSPSIIRPRAPISPQDIIENPNVLTILIRDIYFPTFNNSIIIPICIVKDNTPLVNQRVILIYGDNKREEQSTNDSGRAIFTINVTILRELLRLNIFMLKVALPSRGGEEVKLIIKVHSFKKEQKTKETLQRLILSKQKDFVDNRAKMEVLIMNNDLKLNMLLKEMEEIETLTSYANNLLNNGSTKMLIDKMLWLDESKSPDDIDKKIVELEKNINQITA